MLIKPIKIITVISKMFKLLFPIFLLSISSLGVAEFTVHNLNHYYTAFPCNQSFIHFDLSVNTTNTTDYIKLYFISPFFPSSVYPAYIISTNETITYPIRINLTVPCNYPSGIYPNKLVIVGKEETIEREINVTVPQHCKIALSPSTINLTVKSGESNCTPITIKNLGNKDIIFNFSENTVYIKPLTFTLFRGEERNVSVCWRTPHN